MNSAEFLDAVRAKHGLTSDYQVHKLLDISQPQVSQYRNGKRQFDDVTCIKIADALDESSLFVMASIQAERAKCSEVKGVWEYAAKIGKRAHAVVLLAIGTSASGAHNALPDLVAAAQCILCKVRILWARFALCGAIALGSGCAASPPEKAWQAMHLVDVAQTINGPASDPCFEETMQPTRALIGSQPHRDKVIAWGLGVSLLHYKFDRWLSRTDRLSSRAKAVIRAIDIGYKGFVIGRNHENGTRPFGDNTGCPQRPFLP